MDGLKRRLKNSVQLQLSFSLSLAILVIALLAGVFSFFVAFDEANELQDDVLRQVAQLMQRHQISQELPNTATRLSGLDQESHVFVQHFAGTGPAENAPIEQGALAFPKDLPDGLHTIEIGGDTFRVLMATNTSADRLAVAQSSAFRDEIARDAAIRTVMPLLILVPVLMLMVGDLIRKMFRPITELSLDIDHRNEQDLRAIEDNNLPSEVRPFAVAINRLLARVGRSMATQRRFIADAAHELRSPLTALSLQAERLAKTDMPVDARARLSVLQQGIERGRNLLEQLLALAKAQSAEALSKSPVSVQSVYKDVLEELLPLAQSKQIDIGVEGTQDIEMWVDKLALRTLIKNLVENAIRYTPQGGQVDLSVEVTSQNALLNIRDTGPGIPPSERERVFDPFYRTLGSEQAGSGLGLSIVKTIADSMGARVHLDFVNQASQSGLSVTVFIPIE